MAPDRFSVRFCSASFPSQRFTSSAEGSVSPSGDTGCDGGAAAFDLTVEKVHVLQASTRLAVRLLPCDVLARVAYEQERRRARPPITRTPFSGYMRVRGGSPCILDEDGRSIRNGSTSAI